MSCATSLRTWDVGVASHADATRVTASVDDSTLMSARMFLGYTIQRPWVVDHANAGETVDMYLGDGK